MAKEIKKTSYGIAVGRYNKSKNNQFEILMVRKRYTYYYFSFIFGHYKKYNNKQLQHMFNNMTVAEKIDILSLKYSNMWYRIWLTDPEKTYHVNTNNKYTKPADADEQLKNLQCYFRKKVKFESIFLRDGGKLLRRLINNSTNAVTPWEIPKGAPNIGELELNCATREFEEETGMYPDKYNILWDTKPIITSHREDNITYRSIYYLAYLDKNSTWKPEINFETLNQSSEIEQVQWISMDEIKFLNLTEPNKKRLTNLYKKIKFSIKKKVCIFYYF
jgi:8-oxo-dGTP pyrophosphatase MutT (NUDIX family)